MNLYDKFITKCAHKAIQKDGYHVQIFYIDQKLLAAAQLAVAEAERVGQSIHEGGLWKRQCADQVLANIMPKASEHDRMNAIQVAIEVIRNG